MYVPDVVRGPVVPSKPVPSKSKEMNMKRFVSGVVALTLAAAMAGPALAQVSVGDKMKPLKVGNLHNNEFEVELDDVEGHIVIAEFWATWCGPCIASIPHLNEIHAKYKDKGVLLVAISDEADNVVAPVVKQRGMKYLIGSGGKETQQAYGVQGIPHSVLIDPTGTIRWIGHPQNGLDRELEKLLASSPPTRLLGGGPDHNEKVFATIETSLLKGDNQGAVKMLRRVDLKSLDEREGHRARYNGIVNRLTPLAQADFDRAMAAARAKNYGDALATLSRVATEFKGLPIAAKAAAELKRLEADPEVLASKRNEALEGRADNMLKRAKAQSASGEHVMAYKRLKHITEQFPGTAAAKEAADLVKTYEADTELMKKINEG